MSSEDQPTVAVSALHGLYTPRPLIQQFEELA